MDKLAPSMDNAYQILALVNYVPNVVTKLVHIVMELPVVMTKNALQHLV